MLQLAQPHRAFESVGFKFKSRSFSLAQKRGEILSGATTYDFNAHLMRADGRELIENSRSMKSSLFETLQHVVVRRLRAELRGEPLSV
jgi:hypothetical protein